MRLEPRLRHQGIRDRRVEDVEEWLVLTAECRLRYAGSEGREGEDAVLVGSKDPGDYKADIG